MNLDFFLRRSLKRITKKNSLWIETVLYMYNNLLFYYFLTCETNSLSSYILNYFTTLCTVLWKSIKWIGFTGFPNRREGGGRLHINNSRTCYQNRPKCFKTENNFFFLYYYFNIIIIIINSFLSVKNFFFCKPLKVFF